MNKDHPIILTVFVQSTNGTTCVMGYKRIVDELLAYRQPKEGEVFEDKHWKAIVIESKNLMENPPNPHLGNTFGGGVVSMSRSSLAGIELVRTGRWTLDDFERFLNAVINNDPTYLPGVIKNYTVTKQNVQ
jgi:hypothetical protein